MENRNINGNRQPDDLKFHPEELERFNEITAKIIGCAFQVANTLGHGFLEKVYENALAHEMKKSGLNVIQQYPLKVWYDDVLVGEYAADLFVNGCVLVELKAIQSLDPKLIGQCTNYLRATGTRLCLLINFGTPKIQIKRIAL